MRRQRSVRFDQRRETTDMDGRIAKGQRDLRVDQPDHDGGRVNGRPGACDRESEATEAMVIGWRNLDKGNIERQIAIGKHGWNRREEDWRVIRPTLVNGRSDVCADKERVMADVSLHFGSGVRGWSLGVQRNCFDVCEFGSPFAPGR